MWSNKVKVEEKVIKSKKLERKQRSMGRSEKVN
jgi:hypothetical protein